MKRLAIITSHPIQYNAPLFKLLAQQTSFQTKVFYTWGQTKSGAVYDPDFRQTFSWDIPLLDGYDYEFIENTSSKPGAGNFWGIQNELLFPVIDQFKPDALMIYGWSFHSHLKTILHYSKKCTIIFRGDSTLLDEAPGFSVKKILRRIFLKWVYSKIDIALYTGKANKEYYLKHGLKEEQLIFAPHAIDNSRFEDHDDIFQEKAYALRRELEIPETATVFLFAGKMELKKNPELLVKAFLKTGDHHSFLVMAGNGVLKEELVKNYSSYTSVKFLPFQNQSQMPVLYRMADVFVLPSQGPGETWGLSVNEAMASSRPVIVSDKCGCAADLVENGINGFVFESGNLQQLINYLSKCLVKKDRIAMASASRERIKNFTHNKTIIEIEKLVKQC